MRVINKTIIILSLIAVHVFSFTLLVVAVELETTIVSPARPRDIYEGIGALVDSLRLWSRVREEEAPRENRAVSIPDTLDLTAFFPGCRIEGDAGSNAIRIELPRYADLLTTTLMLDRDDASVPGNPPPWVAPVDWNGEHLFVDGIPVPVYGQLEPDSILLKHIAGSIVRFRTICLPAHLRAESPACDTIPILVTVRGRDTIDIPFPASTWFGALGKIAAGMQVYSGLLGVNVDADGTSLRYYMLITRPGIEGHHFLEWRENLTGKGRARRSETIHVMFTPFIRTDNLKDLFAELNAGEKQQE